MHAKFQKKRIHNCHTEYDCDPLSKTSLVTHTKAFTLERKREEHKIPERGMCLNKEKNQKKL